MANPSGNSQFSERPKDRNALYERIRTGSKEAFILEDMQRLGFWPIENGQPSLPAQIIQEETLLSKELDALLAEKRRMQNTEELIRAIRKQRMEEALKKRAETKLRNEQLRKDKAANWAIRKQKEVLYLGKGFSAGLNAWTHPHPERLAKHGLPEFSHAMHLAEAMGLNLGQLRWLAFHKDVSRTSHYRRFMMKKKSGGMRQISAPMPRLKAAQHWILDNILSKVPVEIQAQGFVPGRSILSNAQAHLRAEVMVNMDFRDFFPTFQFKRVKGLFHSLGYPEAVATIFGMICTEAPCEVVELDGETWHVNGGIRQLPQGAPTSPAITNLLCRRLDRRLAGMAKHFGFQYTRYADDLSFSATGASKKHLNQVRHCAKKIIEAEGLFAHPDKERVMRKGSRKEVTGIVVNDKMSLDRVHLRKFRALLHQVERDKGFAGKSWGSGKDVVASMLGYASYVAMVDKEKGKPLYDKVMDLGRKYDPHFLAPKKVPKPKPQRPKYVHKAFSGVVPGPLESEVKKTGAGSPVKTSKPKADQGQNGKSWWQFWKK